MTSTLTFVPCSLDQAFNSPIRQADGLRQENSKAGGVEDVCAPRWSCDVAVVVSMGAMIGARRQGLVHHVVFVCFWGDGKEERRTRQGKRLVFVSSLWRGQEGGL